MIMEQRLVKIGAAAEMLGTKPDTLRKRERTGELLPTRKTRAGTRYCAVADLLAVKDEGAPTIAYVRVSSYDQKADLDRQHEVLKAYCGAKGWRTQIIRDLGSGMNYKQARTPTTAGDDSQAANESAGFDSQRQTA